MPAKTEAGMGRWLPISVQALLPTVQQALGGLGGTDMYARLADSLAKLRPWELELQGWAS